MKKIWNNKGMVLPTVIIIGAIVIMTGIVLLSTGVVDVKSGLFVERKTQAYYTARAAAEAYANSIGKDYIVEGISSYDSGAISGNIGSESYDVVITKEDSEIKVKATSTHQGITQSATVILEENITYLTDELDIKNALYSDEIIGGNGTVYINGDIATSTTGEITLGSNLNLNGNSTKIDLDYPLPDIKSPPEGLALLPEESNTSGSISSSGVLAVSSGKVFTLSLTGDGRLSNIDNKGSLVIDLNGQTRKLRVDNISRSGAITIIGATGDAHLELFVDNSMNITGPLNWDIGLSDPLTDLEPEKLMLYDYGTENISIGAGYKFSGYYYVYCGENGDQVSKITVNGNSGLVGRLVTNMQSGLIEYGGGTTNTMFLIYAPEADFKMSGNATIEGAIITKTSTLIGTATITYNSMFDNIIIDGVEREDEVNYDILRWTE